MKLRNKQMSDLDAFRTEVRSWLEENCPESMRTPMPEEETVWGGRSEKFVNPDSKVWLERMAEKGWTCPTWPKEYGADARHKPATLAQNAGYGEDAFAYLRRHNEAIFRGYRSATQWLMVLLALFGSAWLIHARRKGCAQ